MEESSAGGRGSNWAVVLVLMMMNVKSILLYGSETWLFNNEVKRKLQTFINRCLHRIFNIHWPEIVSNQVLWDKVGEEPVEVQIRRRKWSWIGHTLRKNSDSIERSALEWNPQGPRHRGRPRGTWRRTVQDEMNKIGKSWNEVKAVANNRVRWKSLTDALCS